MTESDRSTTTAPRRALVTGGAGFIGSHLTRRLLRDGWSVTVVDNLTTGTLANLDAVRHDPRLRFHAGDVRDLAVLEPLTAGCEVIVHLAAAVGVDYVMSHPIDTVEVNVGGTETVVQLADRRRIPLLLASTSEVYGKGARLPFSEDDDVLIGPTSAHRWSYAASKMVDEFLALAYARERHLPVVVFRLFNTVGPGQVGRYGMVVPRFVDAALSGEALEVYGDGGQTRCFLHVDDAVDAIVGLIDRPAVLGQVLNVGSSTPVTIRRLAELTLEAVRRLTGRAGGHIVFRRPEEVFGPGYEDVRHRAPDISRIERLTGWTPLRTLADILDDMVIHLAGGRAVTTGQDHDPHTGPVALAAGHPGKGGEA